MRGEVLTLLLVAATAAPAQRVIEARPTGPTVAQAIASAKPGDRIVVTRGVYREPTIIVDRPLTIAGEPGAVLDGGAATHIMRVEADDVTIRGLAFENVAMSHVEDRAAIRVGEVKRCVIEDNRIDRAFFGVYLAGTSNCRIARNTIRAQGATEEASGNGIHLWTARGVQVIDNTIAGQRDGIYLEFTHDALVRGNTSEKNIRYGLHFMYSDGCSYERNIFSANQAGVAVMYTKHVAMLDNHFQDNWGPAAYGLLLKEIYDVRLERNRFERNTAALLADGATRLVATGNQFRDNGWAVKLMASTQEASLTGNVFVGNTFDVSTNSRGGNTTLAGNYWDEYRGYDLDGDGAGDVPHRPVRLFSLIVERHEPSLLLLRSPLVSLLDRAERILPSLTPETLTDASPLMRMPR